MHSAFEVASKLISRGASLDLQNKEGRTALTLSILEDCYPAVKFLLSKGANPHIPDDKGMDTCDYST